MNAIAEPLIAAGPSSDGLPRIAAPAFDRLGRPLRDLRLSVIDQCNFRCTYCMPRHVFGADYPFLRASERLSFDQMVKLARAFASLGVEKIRITGGEPLLRRGLEALIERLARLTAASGKPMDIAMTTNGSLLASRARALRDAGLGRVTVSLDAVDQGVFRRMSDVDLPVTRILDGIEQAQAVGLAPVKVNAVIQRDVNDSQILPLVRLFRNTSVAVRFIEYMDVGGAFDWSNATVLTAREIRAIVESEFPLVPLAAEREGATAVKYRHASGSGEVGFISSISAPFCGACSRARVSADGQLYTCLFATQGTDLNPWLGDAVPVEQLAESIRASWNARDDRYSELRWMRRKSATGKAWPTVRMSLVGG
ncbi:GTP 3',8-cyclase MoaA [Paraburkholderia sp. CNPSo 3272]|uniref:GTP 3',8-cyclase MoaA n=1 Tax=Paraburkholderia sp. CNPSo 3272 TaxID=2940931 RepID=UPI0020B75293|nr:GTP 3',8-cyclase MoaA [Paraburkholderia sp. CNPSo 3272]MCP3725156.1 GTP 3',8-cyclase MoaA [Paraburkholderia sp. CNPSo 3272]